MRIIAGIDDMRAACRQVRAEGKRLGLVPTMGALHDGHLALVRAARSTCDLVAVSIFVNPLQFGPNEDFAKYPRDLEHDRKLLEQENVDLVFTPLSEDMHPAGSSTYVLVEGLSDKLCGRSRPGHFRGVATVVAKLFHIICPDVAFFGQKDAAQAAIIRRMVRDLHFDVQIVVCPTVRERDGLAMSSRNRFLNPQQRKAAAVLYRALTRIQTLADRGERRAEALISAGKGVIGQEQGVRLDYLEVADPDTLEPLEDVSRGALVAVAAFIDGVRLIDNIQLTSSGKSEGPLLTG